MNRKKITRWGLWFAIIYVTIGTGFYFLQDSIIFHPVSLPRDHVYHFAQPFTELEIGLNDKDTLNMIRFYPENKIRKGLVLYFHGNMTNIGRYAKFAGNFTKYGYEVWMEDYPGFGKSTGSRNEEELYKQAMYIFKLANVQYGSDSILLYGKSLGTGIAAYVAAHQTCRALILETPYYSIPDLFSCRLPVFPFSYILRYSLPVYQYLPMVKCPVTIFHGTNDWVVSLRCADKLKPGLKNTDEFVTIPGGTHNNLNGFTLYHRKLDSLLQLP